MSAETGDVKSELSREIINICNSTERMLELAWEGFRKVRRERLIRAENPGREMHGKEKLLTELR